MRWGFFFLGIILFGLIYEFSELWLDKWGKIDLFILYDREIYPSSYVYYSGETLAAVFLALAIRHLMSLIESVKPYKHFATAFAILETIDLIDFWITGNTLWFQFHGWPVTFNIIKLVIFASLITYEFISNRFLLR